MNRVTCFWCEPADVAEDRLRRYALRSAPCPLPHGYHDAMVVLGEVPWTGGYLYGTDADGVPRDDPRWPQACACGYVFEPADEWQHHIERKWRRTDTGALFVLRDAEPGAMWNAAWWPDKGPDGRCIAVRLPDGMDWLVDGPASSGGRWTRAGTVPRLTVRPSILTPGYHGFLTDGVLVGC